MSSLWSAFDRKNKKRNRKRTPSPTLIRALSGPNSRVKKDLEKVFVERISMLTSFGKRYRVKGSMTVEAALLLPMVMFFLLQIMGFVEMLRLHGKLSFALWECGSQLTVYAAMPGELEENVPDIAVSYLYVGNRVKALLGKDYLDNSPIVQGSRGLSYLASDYEEDCIDIGVTYQVKPGLTLFPFPYMRMVNRYYGRAWTGFDLSEETRYVYVTLYGEVWHAVAQCPYIYITVQETSRKDIKKLRNVSGEKYSACELCGEDESAEMVYYTEQGNRYHKTKECSSLNRYISAILWQETLPYRPCSKCVGEEGIK